MNFSTTTTPRARLFAGGAAAAAALAGLGAQAVAQAAPASPSPAAPAPAGAQSLALEVCCDGRSFRFDNGLNGAPQRGTTFIVSGKIFPAGTFAKGPTNPDSAGSVGTWLCRGTFQYSLSEIANGATPHVATTQLYLFNDGSMLVSEGLEGGQWVLRSITGGTGSYLGARGYVTQEEKATNNTMIQLAPGVAMPAPNIAFNYSLV